MISNVFMHNVVIMATEAEVILLEKKITSDRRQSKMLLTIDEHR